MAAVVTNLNRDYYCQVLPAGSISPMLTGKDYPPYKDENAPARSALAHLRQSKDVSCQLVTDIVYIKTHKTGSSTLFPLFWDLSLVL